MKTSIIDILSYKVLQKANAICFTSNGILKKNNKLVMGAGNAKQFKNKFLGIDQKAGTLVKENGNICQIVWTINTKIRLDILAFPTKHNWRNPSDLSLIKKSALELVNLANKYKWELICLPKPGVGFGKLNWAEVEKTIKPIFDNRFIICSL